MEMITVEKTTDEKRKKTTNNQKYQIVNDQLIKRASLRDDPLFLYEPVGSYKAVTRSLVFIARGRTLVGISANFNTV